MRWCNVGRISRAFSNSRVWTRAVSTCREIKGTIVNLTNHCRSGFRGGRTSRWFLWSDTGKENDGIQNHNYGWNVECLGHWPQKEAFHVTEVFWGTAFWSKRLSLSLDLTHSSLIPKCDDYPDPVSPMVGESNKALLFYANFIHLILLFIYKSI